MVGTVWIETKPAFQGKTKNARKTYVFMDTKYSPKTKC